MNMKNGKVQFVIVTMVLICISVLLTPSMTQAKTKSMPWQEPQEQRDGYSRSFVVDSNSVLLEVPEGRRYVLLKLYAKIVDHEMPYVWDESFWVLTIDGQMFLDEASLVDPLSSQYTFGSVMESFPDNCLVVNGGHTLGISKHPDIDRVHMALIGYFCDMP